jgi:hypothetical protein
MPGNNKKRKMEESGLGYMVIPDPQKDNYARHVKLRGTTFCLLIRDVALICQKFKPSKSFEKYLSDTAAVQVDKGLRDKATNQKIDAAHLCNTSFLADQFIVDVEDPTDKLRDFCRVLAKLSGATTPQSKYDNIGPDKVIDSFQTQYKNTYLKDVLTNGTIPEGKQTYIDYVTKLNQWIEQSKSKSFNDQKSSGFEGAKKAKTTMNAIQNEFDNNPFQAGEIDWALDDDFKRQPGYVDSL